jgi:methionine-S-sulfoxide reductase
MGGHLDEPSYEDVTGHESGHLEAVEVRFDPRVVSYEQVAKRFFEIHDPTQANGQGPDIGSQYLSAVFYTSDDQREATQSLIAKLEARGYDVVTDVRPAARFWPAEDYHQDYYARSGKQPYCHARVKRFGD